MKQTIINWHKLADKRQKLQYAYLTAAVIVIGVAGIFAFFRPGIAQVVAGAGLLLVLTYLLNGIVWGLLQAFVEPFAKDLTSATRTKKRNTKK